MTPSHDQEALAAQLGRMPRGDWTIARRCGCGLPQVITTSPKVGDEPFPTLWWLTCRSLNKAVSRLEASGWMAEMTSRLQHDEALASELQASTTKYLQARDALGRLDARAHPGGGAEKLKCLHAHVAHQLVAEDNPVGRAALEQLDWIDPKDPCV